ncbi:MAG: NUDIX domain-containing protein [Acidobacteriota bacterium]
MSDHAHRGPIPRVVVSAVIRDRAGRFLLVRRKDDGLWCNPGGHVDFEETVLDALHREVLEEAGVTISVERLAGVYSIFGPTAPLPGRHYLALSFDCLYLAGDPRPGGDELDARFFAPSELPPLRSNHKRRIEDVLRGASVVVA